ncbi:hypothetical protein [Microbulbifer sp. GL-2]|uniref:hypothetical protein n=1 Tax=Microbulbifer sp. GL-2 TaxID=2591606 RepID=UPI0011644388|nr:hypothetical protein [Microbulbifer sp. GL-2]BBM02885.1 hypothetical protein GL2_29590 [Microbulbifer sp. GL-2]
MKDMIMLECLHKEKEKNSAKLSAEKMSLLALDGVVTLELGSEGKILSGVLHSANKHFYKNKSSCINKVSKGHHLPSSGGIKFIDISF